MTTTPSTTTTATTTAMAMMTRSHAARWTAVAVVAPLTAGFLAATTVWAATHDPRAEAASSSSSVQNVPAVTVTLAEGLDPDASTSRGTRAISGTRSVEERITRLQARAERIRSETRAILEGGSTGSGVSTPRPVVSPPGEPSRTVVDRATGNPDTSAVAPPIAEQPAPPADTTTGAS